MPLHLDCRQPGRESPARRPWDGLGAMSGLVLGLLLCLALLAAPLSRVDIPGALVTTTSDATNQIWSRQNFTTTCQNLQFRR